MIGTGPRLRLAALVLPVLLLAGAASADARSPGQRAQSAPDGPVLLVGAPGLRWDDVAPATTPAVAALVRTGTPGALSVRSASPRSCPGDGWVMAGAGERARLDAGADAPCPDALPGREVLPQVRADNARPPFEAEVTGLARAVREAGRCTAAVGGPGAELATGQPAEPLAALAAAVRRCALVVVDAGAVHPDGRRAADLRRVDAALAHAVRAAAGVPAPTLLVAGLSDTSGRGDAGPPERHLHVAVAAGRGFGGGSLRSASTRRAPYVQVVDLAPTVLDLLGIGQPAAMSGQPWHRAEEASTPAELADLDRKAGQVATATPRFFALLAVAHVVLYGAASLALRSRRPARDTVHRLMAGAALALTAVPVATYLANLLPWWRTDPALPALLAAVGLFDLLVVAVALGGPWRRSLLGPVGVVCAVTALVLAADLVSGARLQMSSLAGYSPLVAGRFAGVGNVGFGVFATAALLATACAVHGRGRRAVLAGCTAAGLAAVAVDGAPAWGSDLGGVLALVPGFAVLALLAAGLQVSPGRAAGVVLAAGTAVTGFALLDLARPRQERSHLGRFLEQVLAGEAGTVLQRKAAANVELLTSSVLTLAVPLLVVAAALAVLRPRGAVAESFRRAPVWRAGLVAVLGMSVIGFAVNDSGVAVPVLATSVAVPAAVAVAARGRPHPP